MPSFSHCWKPSLPGAGCATALPPSPPHCARIQRTSTCSSSGSYCRSIFCCTSRLSPYDGPRFAMLTAGGSAGMGPHQWLWWHWSTQHSTEGGPVTSAWQSPILPGRPARSLITHARLCPLPAQLAGSRCWVCAHPTVPGQGGQHCDPSVPDWTPLEHPHPSAQPCCRARAWQAPGAGQSLFADLAHLLGPGARSGTGAGAWGHG